MLLVPPGHPDPSVVLFDGMFWNLSPGLPTTPQNQDSSSFGTGVSTQTPPAVNAGLIQSSKDPQTKKVTTLWSRMAAVGGAAAGSPGPSLSRKSTR